MSRVARLIAIIFLLTTCSEEETGSRSYPRVRTLAVTEINSEGALLQGEITFSSTEIIDHGFVWFPIGPLTGTETISLGARSGKGRFESRVESTLAEGVTYSVKAYAKSAEYTVYGEEVTFVSLGSKAPKPVRVVPEQGSWGETILIIGENFSTTKNYNAVKFDDRKATVVSATTDSLKVIVPDSLTSWKSDISVSFLGNSSKLEDAFELKLPQIESLSSTVANVGEDITINGQYLRSLRTKVLIGGVEATIKSLEKTKIICTVPLGVSQDQTMLKVTTGEPSLSAEVPLKVNVHTISEITPMLAFFGDVVTIKGEHFMSGVTPTVVDFGGTNASVISLGPSEIQVTVPYLEVPSCRISVTCNGIKVSSEEDFKLKAPVITSVSPLPLIAAPGGVISIKGQNLAQAKVFLNDTPLTSVIYSSATEIQVTFRSEPVLLSGHTGFIKIIVAQQEAVSNEPVSVPWIRIGDYPGETLYAGVSVVVGDNAYILGTEFWEFEGTTKSWKKLSKPDAVTADGFQFVMNDITYFGSYPNSNLWAYNPSTNTWTQKNDLPFTSNIWVGSGFALNGKAFVINATPYELWEYNDALDEWSKLSSSVPVEYEWMASFPRSFIIGNDLYMVKQDEQQLWKFNGSSETWTNVGSMPFAPDTYSWYNIGFAIGQYGYIVNSNDQSGSGAVAEVWRFDSATNTWTRTDNYTDPASGLVRNPSATFVLDQKGYLVSGATIQGGQSYQDNHVYEFELVQD